MYSELFTQLRTTSDRLLLEEELSSLLDSLFKQGHEGFEEKIKGGVRVTIAEQLQKLISQNPDKQALLEDIQTKLKEIKTIQLTLAIDPTDQILDAVYSWLQNNVSEKLLIDVLVDPSIVAGCVLTYEGKYNDFSFGKKLASLVENSNAKPN